MDLTTVGGVGNLLVLLPTGVMAIAMFRLGFVAFHDFRERARTAVETSASTGTTNRRASTRTHQSRRAPRAR